MEKSFIKWVRKSYLHFIVNWECIGAGKTYCNWGICLTKRKKGIKSLKI